jgi:di/tricarboxylate transporter
MSGDAWITLGIVTVLVIVLVRDLLPPAAAMAGGMVAVMAAQIVEPTDALSGFSNPAPITIAALFVLARAVERTGMLRPVVRGLMGGDGGDRRSLSRVLVPTAAASGLLNNTPIVAMLVPQIEQWCDTNRRSPSRYLMPISFAAILGGLLTLIGTATNVVVSGQLEAAGEGPLGFFEITRVGVPIVLGGLALTVVAAPLLLPARRSPRSDAAEHFREFTVEMLVDRAGAVDGADVATAGLRDLAGVFLIALERDGEHISPVPPTMMLRGDDRLRFVGKATDIVDLQELDGIRSAEMDQMSALDTRRPGLFEAVIGGTSPLVGRTLKQSGFRGRYQAVVLAIHRAGHRIDAKLGEVPLRVGDTLLLQSDPRFPDRWGDRGDFLLISGGGETTTGLPRHRLIVGLTAFAIIGLGSSGLVPLVTAALVGAMVLIGARVLTPGQARDAVDLDVVITIAAAFGVAEAVAASGLADRVAVLLTDLFAWAGPPGVLLGVILTTVALTELITNNAAALLIFPIALSSAAAAGIDAHGAAVAVAVAASASFLTPIGYQTNTMVYGPGGYRFTDYFRLGAPLTLLVVVALVVLVPRLWPAG